MPVPPSTTLHAARRFSGSRRRAGWKSLIILVVPVLPVIASESSDQETWRLLAGFQFSQAAAAFAPEAAPGRESRLAAALARLNRPDRSDAIVESVAAELGALVSGSSADDVGMWAAYHLARIDQVHRRPAHPAAALASHRALLAAASTHPAAQESLLRAAVILLYEPELRLDPRQRAEEVAALAPLVSDSNHALFHLLVGRGLLFHGQDPSAARHHLELAQAAGILDGTSRRSNWITLGELAETAQDRARAIACYRSFLAEAVSDKRIHVVREKIARLQSEPVATLASTMDRAASIEAAEIRKEQQ